MRRRLSLTFLGILLSAVSWAHGTGHGAKIEGKGPNGGNLTAVILAKDSELSDKATTQGVAEWSLKKDKLTIWLYESSLKSQATTSNTIKWILLGSKDVKPVVVAVPLAKPVSMLEYSFDAETLKNTKQVEVILTNFSSNQNKHVFIINF